MLHKFKTFSQRLTQPAVMIAALILVLGNPSAAVPHSSSVNLTSLGSPQNAPEGGAPTPNPVPTPPPVQQPVPVELISASATDWPMYRHNPNHTGNNASAVLVNQSTAGDLRESWRRNVGGLVTSSAALVGESVFIGSHDMSLYSLNSKTGAIKWAFRTSGTVESSPAFSAGDGTNPSRVFFTSSDRSLYAVNAATGKLLWRKADDYSVSSPVVSNGSRYADSRLYVGTKSGKLNAYDFDGNLVWSYATEGEIEASPTLARVQGSDVVIVGSSDTYVYCILAGARTPQLAWRVKTGGKVSSTAAFSDNLVFVGSSDSYMYALNAVTGAQHWKYQTQGPITSSPAVQEAEAGGYAQVYFGSQDGSVYAVRSDTGAQIWSTPFVGPIISSPALGGEVLYIGASKGVFALNASSGTHLWSAPLSRTVNSSPSLSQDMLVVGSADSNVYCFRIPSLAPVSAQPEALGSVPPPTTQGK